MDQMLVLSGTNGDLVTTTHLNNSTIGNNTGFTWSTSRTPEHTRILTGGLTPFMRREPLSNAGAGTYTGAGYQTLRFNTAEAQADALSPRYEILLRNFPAMTIPGKFTVTALVQFSCAAGGIDNSFDTLWYQDSTGKFCTAQFRITSTGQRTLRAHAQVAGVSQFGPTFTVVGNTVYSVTLSVDFANDRAEVLAVDNATGLIAGHSTAASDATSTPGTSTLQDYLLLVGGSMTGNLDYGLVGLDWSNGNFPAETIPDFQPTALVAAQSNPSEITATWTGTARLYRVERQVNSGSWTTASSAVATTGTYTDTGLTDGSTYNYRVVGLIGSAESTVSATSASVTIDDAAYPDATDNFDSYTTLTNLGTSSASWDNQVGTFTVVKPSTDGYLYSTPNLTSVYRTDTWANSHASEVTVQSAAAGTVVTRLGPSVRVQSGSSDFYWLRYQNNGTPSVALCRVNAGTVTVIQTTNLTMAVGEKLRLTVNNGTGSATRLTAERYTGGAYTTLWSSQDPGGTYIDNGVPGIAGTTSFGGDSTSGIMIDDWKGWNYP